MEFGFKETKKGYAKAEVDTYILNLQNLINEFQYKNIRMERKYKDIEQRAEYIKKAARDRAAAIKADTGTAKKLEQDLQEIFKGFISTHAKISKLFSSIIYKSIDNDETTYLENKLNELDESLNLDIEYLNSLKFNNT